MVVNSSINLFKQNLRLFSGNPRRPAIHSWRNNRQSLQQLLTSGGQARREARRARVHIPAVHPPLHPPRKLRCQRSRQHIILRWRPHNHCSKTPPTERWWKNSTSHKDWTCQAAWTTDTRTATAQGTDCPHCYFSLKLAPYRLFILKVLSPTRETVTIET